MMLLIIMNKGEMGLVVTILFAGSEADQMVNNWRTDSLKEEC